MSEQDDALKQMAAHRGLNLAKSRRRKPGGDFGRYGLKDAKGAEVFGFDAGGLTASAEQIEAYLRDATRATWGKSAGSARVSKGKSGPKPQPELRPAPLPPPPPKPKPLPKLDIANLFERLPSARRAEAFTELLSRDGVKLERIVSLGQATPEDSPMVQPHDEWVIVLQGSAGLRIEGFREASLGPGDHLLIEAGKRHWVTRTSTDVPTVWLALHFG